MIKTYRRIVNKDQMFLNSLSQYMWARFFEKGYYEKHRQFLIDFYRKKRDLMCSALSLIPGLSFSVPDGGLVIWIRLPEYTNDRQIAAAAERTGLLLMPGNTFLPRAAMESLISGSPIPLSRTKKSQRGAGAWQRS